MNTDAVKIVVAEDDADGRLMLEEFLTQEGYHVITARDGEEALGVIDGQDVDILITDLKMPRLDGLGLLSKVKREKPSIMVLMLTGHASVNTAVEAMKLGAEDYLTKPVHLEELRIQLVKVIEKQAVKRENVLLKQHIKDTSHFDNIIGKSEPMQRVFELIDKIADSDSTVLLFGESGTGKELVARAIHFRSHRAGKPMVPVNCGAIPEELLESELFGHEKGSFTSAHKTRIGRFELASGGTIFLDEIGDMSPNLQVKILRVLQEHEFERVGGVRPIKADIRVIAATHRNLEQEVADGKFREDLFYRLNVIPIEIPPLRQRKTDIPVLVSYFIEKYNKLKGLDISGIDDEALKAFVRYNWPGNVRELENMVERLAVLKRSGSIDADDLPAKLRQSGTEGHVMPVDIPEDGSSFNTIVTSFEKQLILQALHKSNGVKNQAAKLLNMNRTTLVEKMKKLQIKYNT